MNDLNRLRALAKVGVDWHVMDQSRAASDARIAKATDDSIVAEFAKAARDRITATQARLERVEARRKELAR